MKRIAIIGAGNIGGATAIGLVSKKAAQLTVTTAHKESLARFGSYPLNVSLDNREAAAWADIIIIAVKPWCVSAVISEIKPVINGQIIVSMAPGVSSESFLQMLPEGVNLAYVIPNTAIEVGESMTFISPVSTTAQQTELLKEIFETVGQVQVVPEKLLSSGVSLASCGIAYALRYIRAAAEGGVELGFFADDACRIVSQTVKGAAAILSAHGSHPEVEIDKVTTPGGMTIKGLNAMEENGFTNSVIQGLKANR